MVKVFSRKQTPGNKLTKERLVHIITGHSPLVHRFGFVCLIGKVVGMVIPVVTNCQQWQIFRRNLISLRHPLATLTVLNDIHLM